ncbi:amphi-Trp domain-containing protein [Saccharomonospora sp. NPDC046836]|uniref:amphi-Trp domain-containing protein n=1 Tax=Saccharomonospora sp. NPDC046836 TaxID=3156921 RepID=UPI0034094B99
MSDTTKLKTKQTVTRGEAAEYLMALARALASTEGGEIELAGQRVTVQAADPVQAEIEIETGGPKSEIEIELSWATAGPSH